MHNIIIHVGFYCTCIYLKSLFPKHNIFTLILQYHLKTNCWHHFWWQFPKLHGKTKFLLNIDNRKFCILPTVFSKNKLLHFGNELFSCIAVWFMFAYTWILSLKARRKTISLFIKLMKSLFLLPATIEAEENMAIPWYHMRHLDKVFVEMLCNTTVTFMNPPKRQYLYLNVVEAHSNFVSYN